jgi:hypothetical protein
VASTTVIFLARGPLPVYDPTAGPQLVKVAEANGRLSNGTAGRRRVSTDEVVVLAPRLGAGEVLLLLRAALADPAAVSDHCEEVRDDEDADAPGKGDPDVGADGLLGEQVADRVDDGCHWLVLGDVGTVGV